MESNEKPVKKAILGIGNALVDVMFSLSDDKLLDQFGLPKGSMTLVDATLSEKIQVGAKYLPCEIHTGGSAANTIHGIARLGGSCGYLGKISKDEYGEFFKSEFERENIRTHLFYSPTGTGKATALISADSERTFGTYLGAAMELSAEDISESEFDNYGYLHIEGYLVQNHALIETAVKMAKHSGLKVAIDMASFNVVEVNLDFLKRLVTEYVDIVFANEEEAKSFTGFEPEDALHAIAEMCEIAVVKIGAKGSLIKRGNELMRIDAIPAKSIDTTGAGDIYASGFLYALAEGYPLEKAGKLGSFLAGKVVEVMGAKIPEKQWPALLKETSKILN
ncbi:MAG: sugar kinase [Bacteroidetes bacterium GWF2_42_66]|nr:MAG: sugar kinase [Bacteroidetes bacterium GWA2_42_15]OFX96986.1 MAG: sugar kinase [Bacteroidetes bacterium GWE2_42_39]OFY46014.1 MAG: sugar kinase [Bacteroidetes bacterium GWF2_42_66]